MKLKLFRVRFGTSLEDAVIHGDLKLVERKIKRGADLNWRDKNGNTLLHLAISFGCTEIAIRLIESGVPLEAENRLKITPLSAAAFHGNIQIIDRLLAMGRKRI